MRGSTAIAERLDPQELSAFLSSFRKRVMRLSRLHGGVGRQVSSRWRAGVVRPARNRRRNDARGPSPSPATSSRSIAAGTTRASTMASVRIGVGLHCGEVFSGIIGEEARYEFTVLGHGERSPPPGAGDQGPRCLRPGFGGCPPGVRGRRPPRGGRSAGNRFRGPPGGNAYYTWTIQRPKRDRAPIRRRTA